MQKLESYKITSYLCSIKSNKHFQTKKSKKMQDLISFLESCSLYYSELELANLETLDLSDNQLTTLPESIGQLTNLRALNLSDTQLTTLPESIGQLSNLQVT